MNKHQVNRGRSPRRTGARKFKIPRLTALCLAVAAAVAVSGAPGLGVVPDQRAAHPAETPGYQAIAYLEPVSVSLLSGVDAINFQAPDITSSAAGLGTAGGTAQSPSVYPGQGAGAEQAAAPFSAKTTIVGQSVGALGALPGAIQLIHPVSSRHITSPYGWRNNPTGAGTQIHIGQDYAIACGSPVYASADGVVIQSAWAGHSGMRVTLDHGSSVRTGYSHNSRLIAQVGDRVKQGQIIALSGTTGNSTGCHVHFEVIINGRWNDPRNFLPPISGQRNAMIDSRRTTVAAAPIRYAGTPRTPVAGAHDFPELTDSAPRGSSSAPEVHQEPTAAPKPQTKPDDKARPEPAPKPKSDTKPEPTPKAGPKPSPSPKPTPKANNPKPSPSPKPTPPASPAPTQEPPSEAPTTPAPETSSPETTAPAPTVEPPETKAPAPESEAPTTAVPEPGKMLPPVSDVPSLEVPAPPSGAGNGSDDPSQPSDVPGASTAPPVAKMAPKSATPQTTEPVQEPSLAESGQQPAPLEKAPKCEADPADDQEQLGAPGPLHATDEPCVDLDGVLRLGGHLGDLRDEDAH